MSFGCIPVYSKACHMDMLETTKFNDFVSERNVVDDYVHILKNILELKDIYEYRMFAKKFVEKYTWDNHVQEYVNLFDKL
jgi:glycosyltransferase involved in cell wall biosynthesis